MKIIKKLKELLDDLDILSVKKGEAYSNLVELDLARTIGEVQSPKFISNYIIITREKFEDHVEILKGLSMDKLNSTTEYMEQEIECWLMEYVNKNEDIEVTLQQFSIDLREFESTLFEIRVREEITISPMHEYIENWL
jgi:hypothetical protein